LHCTVITNAEVIATSAEAVLTTAQVIVTSAQAGVTSAQVIVTSAQAVVRNDEAIVTNVKAVVTNAEVTIKFAYAIAIPEHIIKAFSKGFHQIATPRTGSSVHYVSTIIGWLKQLHGENTPFLRVLLNRKLVVISHAGLIHPHQGLLL
jgi:hypothetical protein